MQGIAMKVMAEPGKYSLQQLQQAVQSGSLPAYIGVPLIQEKIKQQKEAQGAQQGEAPQGPSIAEQVMQEARGVEGLPTNLPQQYAGGGIVAFEEGGPVEHYQSAGLVRPTSIYPYNAPEAGKFMYGTPETPEERRRRELLNTPEGRAAQVRADRAGLLSLPAAAADVLLGAPYNAASTGWSALANAVGVPRIGRALGIYAPDVASVEIPRIGTGSLTPFYDKLRAYKEGPVNTDLGPVPGMENKVPLGGVPTSGDVLSRLSSMPTTSGTGNLKPGTGTGVKPAAGPALGAKAPEFTAPAGASYEQGARDFYSDYGVQARNMDVEAEAKKAAARAKVQGEAFEEYKKALEAEAKEAGADKEQARYMSIFKAGLAMMAGTSQHALENIGKGAMVGAEDYQSAVKDLKRAERERRKEFAHIEQARRAEKRGDVDTEVREIDAARDRADARVRFTGEGIYKATGLDKAQAYDLAKTQFNAKSDIFKTDLAGQYTLAAARVRAEHAGEGRGQLTPALYANLRMKAMGQVDENQIRTQVAKRLGLSKPPAPGADARFDAQAGAAMDSAINAIIQRATTGASSSGGGASYQGYRLIPD